MLATTVAVVLVVAGAAAVLAYRVRSVGAGALTQRGTRTLPSPRQALGRAQEVHLHFHGVTPEDVAAIIARQNEAGE